MLRLQRTAGVAIAVTAAVLAVQAPDAGARSAVHTTRIERADRIADELRNGQSVVYKNVTVTGTLVLDGVTHVEGALVCTACTFDGGIRAKHIDFQRGIDLTDSTVVGDAEFVGADFEEPALFGRAKFAGRVDFSYATFDDLAVFDLARFDGVTLFSSARFRSGRFGHTKFSAPASFAHVIFTGDASFSSGVFSLQSNFSETVFGGVGDFRQAKFLRRPGFQSAVFRDRAEFGTALFVNGVTYNEARFAGDASFRDATFEAPDAGGEGTPVLLFDHAFVGARLSLDGSTLQGPVLFSEASIQLLSLDGIDYQAPRCLLVHALAVQDVALELRDLPYLSGNPDDQQRFLHRAEATAKSAGNLALANEIHYRLQVLASGNDLLARRILDLALYRYVAGYFVRPFRPLLWLGGIVLVASVVRALAGRRPRHTSAAPSRLSRAGSQFLQALARTINPRSSDQNQPPVLRRLELSVYALLLAAFMLGIANTNPTLRNMVEALL